MLASAVTCKYRLGGGEKHSRRREGLRSVRAVLASTLRGHGPRFVCSPPPPSRGLRRTARARNRSRASHPTSLFPANSCSKRALGQLASAVSSGLSPAVFLCVFVCVSNQQAPNLELERRKGERVREKPHKKGKRRRRRSLIRRYERVPAKSPLDPSSGSQTE